MWKHLQQFPQFRLTGNTVEESHLHDLLFLERKLDLPFNRWVSGDYKAATDGLSTEVNSLAFEAYSNSVHASFEERFIWNNVLGCHEISYPKIKDPLNQLSSFTQKNGQLMGCPLSFPILCAINLVAYWQALEEYSEKSFNLIDLPCLINGDDILFRSNDAFYKVWQKWIKIAGFQLSVGKNYISPNFLTVNSESWLYNRKKNGNDRFRKINFLNNGLLLEHAPGPVRPSLRKVEVDFPMVDKMSLLSKNSCSPSRALKRFTCYNKEKIKHFTQNGNYTLFGSPETGGLGVIEPRDSTDYYTPFQVKLSKFLYQRNLEGMSGPIAQSDIRFDGMITSICSGSLDEDIWIGGMKVRDGTTCQPTPIERTYDVVLRDKFEPMRENESSLPELYGPKLLNMQQAPPNVPERWSCKRPKRSVMKEFRNKPQYTNRTRPKLWDKVLRIKKIVDKDMLCSTLLEPECEPCPCLLPLKEPCT